MLRAEVGVATIVQGGTFWSGHSQSTRWSWAVCPLLVGAGVLVLIGFLTPAASVLLAMADLALSLSWLPVIVSGLLGGKLTILFAAIVAAAITMLGPGAYSLDARFFGRREVIVPRSSAGVIRR